MALWPEFTGGTYQALSPVMAADQAINVFPETRRVGDSAKQSWLLGTPGLKYETTLDTSVCRGRFTQDGKSWSVVGDTLYERTATATYVSRGTITNDGAPVSFASNGQGGDELGIVGGGQLKVLNLLTDTLSAAITLPFSNPVMIVYQDGYAIINEADSIRVWYSALEDMTTWDALDYFARSTTSDNIVAIGQSRDRVWTFGTKTTTLWYDSGDVDTPFLPYPGTTFQTGIIDNPWCLGNLDDKFCWIAQSAKGSPRVVVATDAAPEDVSTPPIELFLKGCTTLTNAEALVYGQAGHLFVAFTCPSSPESVKTYVYDLTEKLWHARAGWDETFGQYGRWRARGCTVVGSDVLVGDYSSGDMYTLDLETYEDNGVTLPAERIAPYPSSENQWAFISQIELGMQPGVGLSGSGQGSDPQVELQISYDATRTWVSAGFGSLGEQGNYEARAIWLQLGRVRKDRLGIRLIQTDPVKRVWGPGLWLRTSEGTDQL